MISISKVAFLFSETVSFCRQGDFRPKVFNVKLHSAKTKAKTKQTSFGYKTDVSLGTKDSSLVVMKCKKIVSMSKN